MTKYGHDSEWIIFYLLYNMLEFVNVRVLIRELEHLDEEQM